MTGKEEMDSGPGAGMTRGDRPHIPLLRPFDSAHATAHLRPGLGMGMTGGEGAVLRLLMLRSSCGGPSRGGCSTFSGLTPAADPPQAAVPSPAA